MKLALIGKGAIARYVQRTAEARGHQVVNVLVRAEAEDQAQHYVAAPSDLAPEVEVVIDCAGHQALAQFGPNVLARGYDMISLSLGALADAELHERLQRAAQKGGARLHLASGAIGALDALRAASVEGLTAVTYTGRKPPKGWQGSAAEQRLDLAALRRAEVHFEGSARAAALAYPKNANVAAAVALAGLGMDQTSVRLIADPGIDQNIHEVTATGAFGTLTFQISGRALPDNPRSSALAAMSVLSKLDQISRPISL